MAYFTNSGYRPYADHQPSPFDAQNVQVVMEEDGLDYMSRKEYRMRKRDNKFDKQASKNRKRDAVAEDIRKNGRQDWFKSIGGAIGSIFGKKGADDGSGNTAGSGGSGKDDKLSEPNYMLYGGAAIALVLVLWIALKK